jgi:hypothetical protein
MDRAPPARSRRRAPRRPRHARRRVSQNGTSVLHDHAPGAAVSDDEHPAQRAAGGRRRNPPSRTLSSTRAKRRRRHFPISRNRLVRADQCGRGKRRRRLVPSRLFAASTNPAFESESRDISPGRSNAHSARHGHKDGHNPEPTSAHVGRPHRHLARISPVQDVVKRSGRHPAPPLKSLRRPLPGGFGSLSLRWSEAIFGSNPIWLPPGGWRATGKLGLAPPARDRGLYNRN